MSDDPLSDLLQGPYAPRLYVLDGHEPHRVYTLREWAGTLEGRERIVAQTTLLDGSSVSTVFLGLDHNWHPHGPPLLFETALFIDGEGCQVEDRYSTWAEAEIGHMEWVERLTAAIKPDGSLLVMLKGQQ